jgi:hypothetical protein
VLVVAAFVYAKREIGHIYSRLTNPNDITAPLMAAAGVEEGGRAGREFTNPALRSRASPTSSFCDRTREACSNSYRRARWPNDEAARPSQLFTRMGMWMPPFVRDFSSGPARPLRGCIDSECSSFSCSQWRHTICKWYRTCVLGL